MTQTLEEVQTRILLSQILHNLGDRVRLKEQPLGSMGVILEMLGDVMPDLLNEDQRGKLTEILQALEA